MSSKLSPEFSKSIEINGVRSIATVASQSQRLVYTYTIASLLAHIFPRNAHIKCSAPLVASFASFQ